jgi:hypothetical protein
LIILIQQTCSFFFKITPDLLFNQVFKFGFVGAAKFTGDVQVVMKDHLKLG